MLRLELHLAVGLGEDRVVLAHAGIDARVELAAALPHDDVPRNHVLAAEVLDAEALGGRVAAVAGTATCFLMCHVRYSGLCAENLRDLDLRVVLPMTLFLVVMLAAAMLDDADLVFAAVLHHFRADA